MTQDEFEQLVARLETLAEKDPAAYKSRVFGLAMLGYGFVSLTLLLLTIISGLLVVMMTSGKAFILLKKLALPVIALVVVILRAMWIRIPPPEGRVLTAKEFPELFKVLKQIRKKLHGPRIHAVLITDEFNAAISQVPRLGIFGWQKNHLIIGLPLMQALTPKEFVAVIGHEYGHLAGAHSKFSGWIYRVRKTWFKIMHTLDEEERWGKFIFQKFFDWYAPYFSAYTFVLARSNEYDADRAAAEITSPQRAASALTSVYVKSSFYDDTFWKNVFDRVEQEPQPNVMPFLDANTQLRQGMKSDNGKQLLTQIMKVETGVEDTHPALKDRLAALHQEPILLENLDVTAADFFLGNNLQTIATELSNQWRDNISEDWRGRHEYIQESRARIKEIEDKAETDRNEDDNYDLARLYEEFSPEKDTLPLLEKVLAENLEHVSARFRIGRLYLEKGDEQGIAHLEKAMELDPEATTTACKHIYYFLLDRDREMEAEKYQEMYNKRVEHEQEIEHERNVINFDDEYIPHTADEEVVSQLVEQLKKFKRIGKAYLVQKKTHLSDEPLFIVGINFAMWFPHDEEDDRKFNKRLANEIEFPHECFFVVMSHDNKPLKKVVVLVEKSLIYSR